nr:hypothetical protein [Tanacetum cinerariifolium]
MCYLAIRVNLVRPMRAKDCASWDRGKGTWGGRGGYVGTVPVLAGVQEEEFVYFPAGKLDRGTWEDKGKVRSGFGTVGSMGECWG